MAVDRVYGIPLADLPEPLQSALRVTLEREWTGDPASFWPSPLLLALLDGVARWRCHARMAGKR